MGEMHREIQRSMAALQPFTRGQLAAFRSIPRETLAAMEEFRRQPWHDAITALQEQAKLGEQMVKSLQAPTLAALEAARSLHAIDASAERFAREQQRSFDLAKAGVEKLAKDYLHIGEQARITAAQMLRGIDQAAQTFIDYARGETAGQAAYLARAFARDSALAELSQSLVRERFGVDKLGEQMRALSERAYRDWQAAWPAGIDALLGSVANAKAALASSEIEVADGSLTIDGVPVDWQQIEELLASDEAAAPITLDTLPQIVGREHDPKKRARYRAILLFLLYHLLLPLLVGIGSSKIERAWSERPSQQKIAVRAIQRSIEGRATRAVEAGVSPQVLQQIRLVTATTLVVRAKPAKQSARIGELHLGEMVVLIRTSQRSWALVEWSPAGEEVRVRGWVFARYLQKLRLPSSLSSSQETEDLELEPETLACH